MIKYNYLFIYKKGAQDDNYCLGSEWKSASQR